jgi:hypothetical protein
MFFDIPLAEVYFASGALDSYLVVELHKDAVGAFDF